MAANKKTTAEDNGSAGDGLNLYSTLTINTQDGNRDIQLLFGDITCLPPEDKVDVIMVSAFAGDYTATRTSLIGALWYNLNISVRELSKKKDEDLRQHFHCWWSRPLPSNLPYRRLLCFETPFSRSFKHPAELVGDVFRSLVPMFKDKEQTVITPLLATGDQNHSQQRMLRAMLDAAINWIRAGLPLKCLKIVLYTRRANKLSEEEAKVVALFNSIKEKVLKIDKKQQSVEPTLLYDVYLSYHKDDSSTVQEIQKIIMELMEELKFCSKTQTLQTEEAWQEDMYQTLIKCRRIMPFLSPAYLGSAVCVEQYNIALCCNRSTKRNLLAPFYIETIENMPTYMALVQYIDCRLKNGSREKARTGIQSFVSMFQLELKMSLLKPLSQRYDVFISYSHGNSDVAMKVLHALQDVNDKLLIFYDRNELKTGTSWQETLYNSLDNVSIVLALISPTYVQSSVCHEEYNIALAKHLSKEHELELVPLMIEPVKEVSRSLTQVPIIDGTKKFDYVLSRVVKSFNTFYKHQAKDNVFNEVQNPRDIQSVLESHRKQHFYRYFQVNRGQMLHRHIERHLSTVSTVYTLDENEQVVLVEKKENKTENNNSESIENSNTKGNEPESNKTDSTKLTKEETNDDATKHKEQETDEDPNKQYDVAIICADYSYGFFLNHLLTTRCPSITTNFKLKSDAAQLACIDTARLIVPLLSQNFVQSSKDIDEFQIGLARHRSNKGSPVLFPIQLEELPRWPTYIHLVPCAVALHDILWKIILSPDIEAGIQVLPPDCLEASTELLSETSQRLSQSAMIGLSAACDSIIHIIMNKPEMATNESSKVIQNIASLELEAINKGDGYANIPVNINKFLRGVDGQVSTRATKRYIAPSGSSKPSPSKSSLKCTSDGDLQGERVSATCSIL